MKQEIIPTKELTKDNYFEFGDDRRIVVSNSALGYINPNQGGSFRRFKNFLLSFTEKKDSVSLERGKLLHRYRENPETFVVEPEVLPGDKVVEIIDRVLLDIGLSGLSPSESLDDYQAKVVEQARAVAFGGAKGYTSDVVIKKVCDEAGKAYFKHVVKARGSFMVSTATKNILIKVVEAMQANETATRINNEVPTLISGNDLISFDENGIFIAKEFPIYFKLDGMPCKALIDYLKIDTLRGMVTMHDLKTTSNAINTFFGHYEYNQVLMTDQQGHVMPVIQHVHVSGPFQWYRYYRQMAFYQLAVEALMMHLKLTDKFIFKAYIDIAETIDPFEFGSVKITEDWLRVGKEEVTSLMTMVKRYVEHEHIEVQW